MASEGLEYNEVALLVRGALVSEIFSFSLNNLHRSFSVHEILTY